MGLWNPYEKNSSSGREVKRMRGLKDEFDRDRRSWFLMRHSIENLVKKRRSKVRFKKKKVCKNQCDMK